jgi:preprotein translocase subunit SecG
MRNIPVRQLITILTMVALLVAVLVMQRRCGAAMGNLFQAIGPASVDAGVDAGTRTDLTSDDTARK